MKRSLVKLVSLSYLMIATNFLAISCSSSDEGVDEEEIVAEEGNEAADADMDGNMANNEEGNNVANEEGAEGTNNFGEGAEGTNNFGEGTNNFGEGNQAVANEFGNAEGMGMGDVGAEGNALAADDSVNQVIEEMNAGGNTDGMAAVPSEGTENLSADAGAVPVDSGMAAPVSSAPAAAGLPELGSKMTYIVQKGDTLGKIAKRVYGDMNKWTEIADFTGIANPNLVYPGDIVYYQLTETTQAFASSYEAVVRSEVEVGPGDTLATISNRVFGNSTLWKLIWRQNDKISNPDRLEAGTKIFYIASDSLAALDKDMASQFASVKVKKEVKKVVKAEVSKTKTVSQGEVKALESSTDNSIDQFSTINSQNLVARLI